MATDYSNYSDDQLRSMAAQNSADWHGADKATQENLHATNLAINAELDRRNNTTTTYNPNSGAYTTTPAAPTQPAQPAASSNASATYHSTASRPAPKSETVAASAPVGGAAPTARSAASTPVQTTYTDSRGNKYTGYIINGKTYTDAAGTQEVPVGSYVTDASGRVWYKGYGNNNQLVSSPLEEDHYDANAAIANLKQIEFTNPTTGKTNYLSAEPDKGRYTIYDSNFNNVGYLDSAGVHHSAYYDSEYDQTTAQAALQAAKNAGYTFDGNGIVKIANGADQNMERTYLINRYADALDRGEDGADILRQLGYTGEATPGVKRNNNGTLSLTSNGREVERVQNTGGNGMTGGAYGGMTGGAVGAPSAPDLQPILDAWRTASEAAAAQRTDYAVQQGVNELQRAEADAQKQFRTAQEQISADEAYAKDNQALYAEARGDKGGIGAAQYDSIANTAAINRQQVREQQTQLSTDVARQIADLRAQGEFEKADAVLEIAQSYLSNLLELEQWAANYNLSAAQFEESIREWEKNFQLSVAELTGSYNGQPTLAARNADRNFAIQEAQLTGEYGGQPTLSAQNGNRSTLASAGTALLNAGIMPSADQLAAMGMTTEQAQALLLASQVTGNTGGGGLGSGVSNGSAASVSDLFSLAQADGSGAAYITKARLNSLGLTGYDVDELQKAYTNWEKTNTNSTYVDPSKDISDSAKAIYQWLSNPNGGQRLSTENKLHAVWSFAEPGGGDYAYSTGQKYHAQIDQNDRNWLLNKLGLT